MNIIVAFLYLLIALALAAGAYGLIYSSLYGSNHSMTPNTPKGLKPTSDSLHAYNELAAKVAIYQPLSSDNLLIVNSHPKNLPAISTDDADDFNSALASMENIIRSYNETLDSKKLLERKLLVVENFIEKIEKQLANKGDPVTELPNGKVHSVYSVVVPRFLACYLIQTSNFTDMTVRNKALALLKRLVPAYNKSIGKTFSGYSAVFTAVPYLISVLVERPDRLAAETERTKILDAYNFMNTSLAVSNAKNTNKQGRFLGDWAFLVDENEFSYTPIVALAGFYSGVWVSLGLPFTSEDLFKNALNKLLHPNININPVYAFTGFCQQSRNLKYFGTDPQTGIFVYPSVGVGVYKTPSMYFHLRVQKQDQAVISPQVESSAVLAHIAVQSRKIYFLDTIMPQTCNPKYNPGLLWSADDTSCTTISGDKKIKPELANSFIGIYNKNCLVWLNEYKIKELNEDMTVLEIGIFSHLGLFQKYNIENKSGKAINFYSYFNTDDKTGKNVIDAGKTSDISVFKPLVASYDPGLTWSKDSRYKFSFSLPEHGSVDVEFDKDTRIATLTNQSTTVAFDDSDDVDQSITIKNVKFSRDPNTLTYTKI